MNSLNGPFTESDHHTIVHNKVAKHALANQNKIPDDHVQQGVVILVQRRLGAWHLGGLSDGMTCSASGFNLQLMCVVHYGASGMHGRGETWTTDDVLIPSSISIQGYKIGPACVSCVS